VKHNSAQSATSETLLVYLLIYYLQQGSYVYACVCLFVCLFVDFIVSGITQKLLIQSETDPDQYSAWADVFYRIFV